ncbi:hypothetical protein [Methylotenera sp.]|uniref:hypothetical protein n=1 Tax=Methylotenera sp. TaxID=2051956 RepID=UPI0027302D7E|nr:hypothetical protein [Methylotenera sp.]MDP2230831.1 hypothetical protein [Methylotenera sp.]
MTTKKTITLTPELEIALAEKKINFNAYVNNLIKEDLFNTAKPSNIEIDLSPLEERNELILKEILIANDALNKNDRDSEEIKNDMFEMKSNYQSVERAIIQLQQQSKMTITLLGDYIKTNNENLNKLARLLQSLQKK